MSYCTEVRISFFGEDHMPPLWDVGPVNAEMLLAKARFWLSCSEWSGAVDDIMERLTPGFESGSTMLVDIQSSHLTRMFLFLSGAYEAITLRIWGFGEEFGDVWAREFKGGEVTFSQGPFVER